LSLQQIRCFCAVELGSFTAAAAALRVSQPAVADQVRKLEQALGADLFVRAGRGVVLTDAARAFAEHAARSLRAVEETADSVGELSALRAGTVALGIFGGPSAWNMDELAARFLRRHPDVSLRLIGRNSSSAYTHAPYYPPHLTTAPFDPPLYDTFAIITRPRARLSPGVREVLADIESHMRALADRFDRAR
jgi:hypothetical protein